MAVKFEAKDDTDRPIQIKVMGPFAIPYRPDIWAKELRVIKIEWA